MEYLEGETLAERLSAAGRHRWRLPTRSLTDRHRDLRRPRQRAPRGHHPPRSEAGEHLARPKRRASAPPIAKLLDFGLAKTAAPAVAATALSMLPTTPPNLTAQGTILGTFQYMAPEQIEGLEADARTDIFAFGALLFEMVTGRRAFEGKTRASLLGAILERRAAAGVARSTRRSCSS